MSMSSSSSWGNQSLTSSPPYLPNAPDDPSPRIIGGKKVPEFLRSVNNVDLYHLTGLCVGYTPGGVAVYGATSDMHGMPFLEIVCIKASEVVESHMDFVEQVNKCKYLHLCTELLRVVDQVVELRRLWLVFEFPGDSVRKMYPLGLSDLEKLKLILKGALVALVSIHTSDWVHCDIHSGHLYLTSIGDVKMGFEATLYDDCSFDGEAEGYLNPNHICDWAQPPEGKLNQPSTDIWQLGVTALEMTMGRFKYNSRVQLDSLIGAFPQWTKGPFANEQFKYFIQTCLAVDPNARPSAFELIDHPFFR